MSRLLGEITPEQIDEWFKIGKKSVKIQSVARSSTGGKILDPSTRKPLPKKEAVETGHRRRAAGRGYGVQDYAAEFQEAEERLLLNQGLDLSINGGDTVSVVSSTLERLELDTVTSVGGGGAGIGGVVPHDLVPENATEVYNQYNFSHQYDGKLPISNFQEEVTATIESNQVTVVQGATGSGKTTQVPQFILDHYAQMNKYCNIIVTQPRRIAAISIARRVCHERGWELGTVCGYQVGLDKVANEDTRILYCTTGILLQKLINRKDMLEFTHVIVDEVHERDQDTDFALLVVRKLLRTNSPLVKVILMSATFDSELFASYFALPVRGRLEPAPVVVVEGKPFDVSEYYAEDLSPLGELPPLHEGSPEISEEAHDMAIELIKKFDTLETQDIGFDPKTQFAPVRGTVLMFLPGIAEISRFEVSLSKISLQYQLTIIPLHSTITMEEQSLVFEKAEPGFRKVILSTNIAESSITVPDIKYVIDFCLTKNNVCDLDTNYTALQVQWASKANCTQRKGRAGRVSNGRVYRMVTRRFYEDVIPEYGIPEMQRCPLDKLILKVKLLDLGEPKAILALALAPPNLDDIEKNILMLKEVGALSTISTGGGVGNRHDGELTFVGRILADLPVDIRIGKLVILGHVFGLLEECLIIGASMSLKSMFATPYRLRLEAYRRKLGWADGSLSDSIAILNAYTTWENNKNRGHFRRGKTEKEWGQDFYLQIRRLREISELIKDLDKRLYKFNIQKPQHPPHYRKEITQDQERLLLKMVLCGAFYPNYFVRGEIDEMESLKSLSGRDPLNTVMVKGLPANQGTLYKTAVEDQFRKCEANPTAYFEETRAYVEFPWKHVSNSKSKVHLGVYMALKMKYLRLPIQIELYSADDARAMMQTLQSVQDQMTGPRTLRTNRLTMSSTVQETGTERKGFQVPPPDPKDSFTPVIVTEVLDCGHFYVQYSNPENYQQMAQVQHTLNASQGRYLRVLTETLRTGMFCVAPYKDETIEYYRARIQSIDRQVDQVTKHWREMVEVFYVDYGNTAQVPREELRILPTELLDIPFQAVECHLKGLRPSAIKCPDGKWTKEAKEMFMRLTLQLAPGEKMYAQVYSVIRSVLRLELIKCGVREDQRGHKQYQVYVGQKLIDFGYADEAEESFLSKQNHEQREMERVDSTLTRRSVADDEDDTGRRLTGPNPRPVDFLELSVGARDMPRAGNRRGSKITLTGPTNPYEMTFYNITSIGRLRTTKVEPDSVNSIAIDDEPHDPHQRMMVAGFVGLNPTGTSMIARDTTILPLIPGLPALVTLLFTPVAEFRTDPGRTHYTGALCGLGTDPHAGHQYPALADHDIELAFDVKFDIEDIYKINAVRMAINIAIGSQDNVSTWGPDAIYKIQASARKKLLDLIQKRRESIDVYNFDRPYQWNQLEPDNILHPFLEDQNMDCPMLLNLHSGVAIEEDDEDEATETRADYLKKHVQMLKEVVRRNTKRGPTLCELCSVTCPTPQLLHLHLQTGKHKEKEERLMQSS